MDDLVMWLKAQLDEDERQFARSHRQGPWRQLDDDLHARNCDLVDGLIEGNPYTTCDCGVPDRALREIKAKRRIVRLHEPCADEPECHVCGANGSSGTCLTLCLLAQPFADRPGYREEWRP